MNRVVKAVILSVAALATTATTVEYASAGDRYWRKHHVVKPWQKRAILGGVAVGIVAGAVIATRPRVIYREDPVIVDEAPIYDDEGVYGEAPLYADPDEDYDRQAYRYEAPDADDADDYAAPAYDQGEFLDEERSSNYGDDYFPDKPAARAEQQRENIIRKQTTSKVAPKKETVAKPVERKEASAAAPKAWSKEWRDYCTSRFPSFNPQNGTYLGYDKKRHFCKAG